ncbi:UNVERIFIED_CONTAM: hypothetical protein FKN15_063447 [Acipenser sinensis]
MHATLPQLHFLTDKVDVFPHVKGDSLTVSSQDQEFECTEKTQVDKAVRFWNNLIHNANVDIAFKKLYAFLNTLNQCIKDGSATDQENAVTKTEADKEISAENAVPNETSEEPMLEEGLVGTKCACLKLTAKANVLKRNKRKRSGPPSYKYKRLMKPVPSGIYECSAWCKCDLKLCQNRVVQHGLRVRLQVFKTEETGWGVRCLDDIDEGTFVCTYAGKILIEGTEHGFKTDGAELESGHGDADPAGEATKRKREAASSDDDIEVIEETQEAQECSVLEDLTAPQQSTDSSKDSE